MLELPINIDNIFVELISKNLVSFISLYLMSGILHQSLKYKFYSFLGL